MIMSKSFVDALNVRDGDIVLVAQTIYWVNKITTPTMPSLDGMVLHVVAWMPETNVWDRAHLLTVHVYTPEERLPRVLSPDMRVALGWPARGVPARSDLVRG